MKRGAYRGSPTSTFRAFPHEHLKPLHFAAVEQLRCLTTMLQVGTMWEEAILFLPLLYLCQLRCLMSSRGHTASILFCGNFSNPLWFLFICLVPQRGCWYWRVQGWLIICRMCLPYISPCLAHLWAELGSLQNPYMEALSPRIWEYDCGWKPGL